MNTKQYYYLSTIAEYGNLSYAADALSLSPSALSKFLGECERTFGFALFLRYGRRLYPTAVGRYVVECAQKILDEQNRMLLTMKDVAGVERKRIRLATAPNRGATIYSKIYNPFSRRYPDIALSLVELYAAEQPGAIARGTVDLALGAGTSSTETTDIPIAYEELLVSLPAAHPLAKQERIRLEDLRETPFVLQGPRHSIRRLADQLFQEAGFQPVVAFESDDVLLVDSMMHQAVGVGLVSKAHVFPCEELVYRPLDPPVRQTLHLRYPLGHTLTEPEYYLAGLLAEERLADSRYQPADDPFVAQLLENVRDLSASKDKSTACTAAGTALQTVQEVNLDTKVMEYLIAIVEEQSLSKAAERFFLAQPALSRHLRNVEAMVGIPLFSREHNRLHPTSAGTVFVNNARNILRIENEMFAHTQSYYAGRGGHLYISCDALFLEILHKKVEPAFHRLHPELTLVFTAQNQEQTLEALSNSSADLGVFLSTELTYPLLHCDVLDLTEMVYCFAPEHRPANWQPGDPLPHGFAPHPQLLAEQGSTLRGEQDALFQEFFSASPAAACEAVSSILRQLANLGIADCILPLNLLDRAQHLRCAAFEPPKPLYLLLGSHIGRTLPTVAKELDELIRNALGDVLELPKRAASVPFSNIG